MFYNYLKIALRNLRKFKVHSCINITGLAVAIAFCILAFLFVRHEISYDTFHENGDRIYMALTQKSRFGASRAKGDTPPILAPTLVENMPEIESAVRMYGWSVMDGVPVIHNDHVFNMSGFYVDPGFFRMFSFPIISGNPETALQGNNAVVITKSMAKRYFEDLDPIGKTLTIRLRGKMETFFIAGIVEVPENSCIQFDFVLSFALKESAQQGWGSNNLYTFLQLREGVVPSVLEQKAKTFFKSYFRERDDNKRSEEYFLSLLPLKKLYLNTIIEEWLTLQSDPRYSYIISAIALFMLLIACVNFVNLTIGLYSTRIKEVSVRKVVGASRGNLIKQYLSEAMAISFFALVGGVTLASLLLPLFNQLLNTNLVIEIRNLWLPILGLVILITVFSGLYPAIILSGFQPVTVFRGNFKLTGNNTFSRILIVLQFSVSIILVVTTLTMSRQMRYLHKIDLGFRGDQVVVIDVGGWSAGLSEDEVRRMMANYRQEALQNTNLISMTMTSMSYGRGDGWGSSFNCEDRVIRNDTYSVGYDYTETLGISVLKGRDFSREFPADFKESILVNESMVKALRWDDPIGKRIPTENRQLQGTIIGVLEDVYLTSMHEALRPAVYHLQMINGSFRYIVIRIQARNLLSTLERLKTLWQEAIPYQPFLYSFLNDDVEAVFREDERWLEVARFSSMIAVFIACLGAFGLTSLTLARRTKEVGIRKVLGASITRIIHLLTREFTVLVLIANVIAWPVAWLFLRNWLQDFVYRIQLGPATFCFGALITLLIVLSTIGLQIIQSAKANPVEALRCE